MLQNTPKYLAVCHDIYSYDAGSVAIPEQKQKQSDRTVGTEDGEDNSQTFMAMVEPC